MPAAQPLKVNATSTPSKAQRSDSEKAIERTPVPAAKQASGKFTSTGDVSSPHELTAFVESLLEQLDTKFDEMSSRILDRMDQMSSRVDTLEAAIQDIINGDTSPGSMPQSPASTPGFRRVNSGL